MLLREFGKTLEDTESVHVVMCSGKDLGIYSKGYLAQSGKERDYEVLCESEDKAYSNCRQVVVAEMK